MLDPVTIRYVEALFGLARKEGVLDDVARDVENLAAEFASSSVSGFFFDARVSVETRREKLAPALEGLHQLTRNFVNLLFDKRREGALRNLGQAWKRRMLVERGEAEGIVESARPLGDAELSRLAASVGSRLGKRVSLHNEVLPELLGGVRVVVDSRMLDRSYSGRLEGLRKRMLEAPLPTPTEA